MNWTPPAARSRGLNKVLVVVAGAVLAAIVGISYHQSQQYHRANDEALQTRQIQQGLDGLMESLLNAETGQRGYLLTGEQRYLEPYDQASREIPSKLTHLRELLAKTGGETARLSELVNAKQQELAETIKLRRSSGPPAALAVVLSDRGKRAMDEIRGICEQLRARQFAIQSEAARARETAAQAALLVTIGGALLVLFFLAAGAEPVITMEGGVAPRPWWLVYGAVVMAVAAMTALRMALGPLIGAQGYPFILSYPAVLFAVWFGGLRPGLVSIVLSAAVADYYFAPPTGTFWLGSFESQVATLVFILGGFGIVLLGNSQRKAVTRSVQAEQRTEAQRRWLHTTLASIGDAVIATDADGRIVFTNGVAQRVTRWPEDAIQGRHLDEVFRIVNEATRETVESPVAKVLREGKIVGLANHTVLVARDGAEVPIEDSGAPIRDEEGEIRGTVLVFRDITERKAAEKEVEETHDWLRRVLSSIGDAVIATDARGRVLFLNAVAEGLTGWEQKSAHGMALEDIFAITNADTGLTVENPAARALAEGRVVGLANHTVLTSRDGRRIPIEDSAAPIRDGQDGIVGVVLVFRDVTDREQAARALRESEARFRQLAESMPQVVWTTTADGVCDYVNQRWTELTGCDLAATVALEYRKQMPAQDLAALERAMQAGYGEGTAFSVECRFRQRDGGLRWHLVRAVPVRDDAGAIVRWFGTSTDIQEQKRAEEEIQFRIDELEAVLDAVPAFVWFTRDPESREIVGNRAANTLLGVERGTNTSQTSGGVPAIRVSQFKADGKEYRPEELPIRMAAATGKAVYNAEIEFRFGDGRRVHTVGNVEPLFDAANRVRGGVAAFLDITERKKTQEALMRANDDLNQFAFAASHDLQEPLRMITTYSQLLLSINRGDLDEKASMCVRFITQGTQRMRTLLADLLAYTQLASDGEAEGEVDLNDVEQQAAANLKAAIEESGAEITQDALPVVRGAEAHFLQLFQNLIGNAIKYRGPEAPRIHLSAERRDGEWLLGVSDNGIGIEPQYHQRIFGVFKRLHGQSIPGTGIGLAICQRVVERYGGKIWVESQIGRGATFYFTIRG